MELIDIETKQITNNGSIAIMYLNNPETKNSLTLEMGMRFNHVLKDFASQEPQIRCLIITGKNDVFSSGGDFGLLESFARKDPEENKSFMESFYRLFLEVRNVPFPVIAAVNGHAIGASLAIALACDLRYFDENAKYAFNFVKLGIHPGMGASYLLKDIAGTLHAQELLLTGRFIDGQEAFNRGLCHGISAKKDVLKIALKVAEEIAVAAPQAVRLCKQGLYRHRSLEESLDYESAAQAQNYTTQDFKKAIEAIKNKSTPVFSDI